ncbi:hypothetical protein SEA_ROBINSPARKLES_73 [Gordonia phage RobinSparkles]|nr:hypothetical protein SEA_ROBINSPARKLES_73 [Gordonia phage RobinSparkles]
MINKHGHKISTVGPLMSLFGLTLSNETMGHGEFGSVSYETNSDNAPKEISIFSCVDDEKVIWYPGIEEGYQPGGYVESSIKVLLSTNNNEDYTFLMPVIPKKGVFVPILMANLPEGRTIFNMTPFPSVDIAGDFVALNHSDNDNFIWTMNSDTWTMRSLLANVTDRIGINGYAGDKPTLFNRWLADVYVRDGDSITYTDLVKYHKTYATKFVNLSGVD